MAVLLMLISSACFATMSAMVKEVGPGIPPAQMVCLRCLLASPLLYLFVRFRGRPSMVSEKRMLVVRTLFGLSAMLGYFFALPRLPLADTIFIGRSQPLILTLLAPLVVKERAPAVAWVAIITGLLGVGLVMTPAMAWGIAAWVAFGSAAASAMAHLFVRKLNATEYPLVIVFNFTLLTGLITSTWAVPAFVPPTPRQWVLIGGVAVFASMGQLLLTLAYQKDRAPVVASASYSSVVLAVVYGYFIWGEVPHPMAWAGGVLIVGGGLLLLKNRWRVHEPPSPAAT